MKKKNVLMMALSLALVAVIAVGGTLAYLTAQDGTLTNTFTFAGNIEVDLMETAYSNSYGVGSNSALAPDVDQWKNIQADTTYEKLVQVKADPKSGDAYVFVYVKADAEEGEATLELQNVNTSKWTKLVSSEGQYTVYYREVQAADESPVTVFDGVKLVSENGKVTVDGEDATGIADIVVSVYAVQKEGFTNATEAYKEAIQGKVAGWPERLVA